MLDDEITQEDLDWCDRAGLVFQRSSIVGAPWYELSREMYNGWHTLGEGKTLGEAIREATMMGWGR